MLDHFGIAFKRSGDELRFRICATCGTRSRPDAVAANCESGLWRDHAHRCSGDLFSMVAGFAWLDVERDFGQVLELAADIGGVAAVEWSPEKRARRAADCALREVERQAAA